MPKLVAQRRGRQDSLEENLKSIVESVEVRDEEAFPALKEALAAGVSVNIVVNGATGPIPMFLVFAHLGMIKCFEECLSKGIMAVAPLIPLALFFASMCEASDAISLKMTQLLLSKFNKAPDNIGMALDAACARRRLNVLKLFMSKWGGKTGVPNQLLGIAIESNYAEAAKLAIDSGAGVDAATSGGNPVVIAAASLPDSAILEALIEAGADIEVEADTGETPLLAAIRNDRLECVQALLAADCDHVNAAVRHAIYQNRADICRELVTHDNCDEFEPTLTAMQHCIATDDVELLKILFPLLDAGAAADVVTRLVCQDKCEMLKCVLNASKVNWTTGRRLDFFLQVAKSSEAKQLIQAKINAQKKK